MIGWLMGSSARVAMVGVCLAAAIGAGAARAQDSAGSCGADGWEMSREIAAFKSTAENLPAAVAQFNLPPLELGVLYVLKLSPQERVQYPQSTNKKSLVRNPLGGLATLTVPADGQYRITVDSPLWIDVVGPDGIIAPSAYTGWHECRLFRKSVEYALPGGKPLTVQISEATPELIRIVVVAKH
jgi:hypothetical protein